jgi:tetratricopeptide (TPR) repeat protein
MLIYLIVFLSLIQIYNRSVLDIENESSRLINNIIVKIYHSEFDSAKSISKNLRIIDSETASLYDLIIDQSKNKEYETLDKVLIEDFYNKCELYINVLEDKYDQEESAKTAYLLGNVYLLMASEDNRLQSMFSAYSNSSSAVSYLEDCLELDSTMHDAKLGLGFYKYWKSVKTKSIPFFVNEIDQGLQYIDEAIKRGKFAELTGKHQKVFVLNREERYDEAYLLAIELIKKYPNSKPIQWAYAEALLKKENYLEAYDVYSSILGYYIKISADFNIIEIKYKMLLCIREKNKEEAIGLAEKILNYKLSEENKDRLSSKLDKVEDILDELKEKQ